MKKSRTTGRRCISKPNLPLRFRNPRKTEKMRKIGLSVEKKRPKLPILIPLKKITIRRSDIKRSERRMVTD